MMSTGYEMEFDQETDGRWIAEIPSLPGVLAYGAKREDACARVLALAQIVEQDKLRENLLKNQLKNQKDEDDHGSE